MLLVSLPFVPTRLVRLARFVSSMMSMRAAVFRLFSLSAVFTIFAAAAIARTATTAAFVAFNFVCSSGRLLKHFVLTSFGSYNLISKQTLININIDSKKKNNKNTFIFWQWSSNVEWQCTRFALPTTFRCH